MKNIESRQSFCSEAFASHCRLARNPGEPAQTRSSKEDWKAAHNLELEATDHQGQAQVVLVAAIPVRRIKDLVIEGRALRQAAKVVSEAKRGPAIRALAIEVVALQPAGKAAAPVHRGPVAAVTAARGVAVAAQVPAVAAAVAEAIAAVPEAVAEAEEAAGTKQLTQSQPLRSKPWRLRRRLKAEHNSGST